MLLPYKKLSNISNHVNRTQKYNDYNKNTTKQKSHLKIRWLF